MTESIAADPAAPPPRPPRVGKIVRWAARVTSIPILILVLTSLIPAMLSFSISAKDDKVIAIGLCATCLGLLLGWKWAGIGGGIILAGVVTILSQSDDLQYPDPFSVAFGLQGALFLLSSLFNSQPSGTTAAGLGWARKATATVLVLLALGGAAVILRGPGPVPLPKDKEPFVGVWKSPTGFNLEIKNDGHASVTWEKDTKADPTNNPVAPGISAEFFAYFHGDDELELAQGLLGHGKIYRIDRLPKRAGKETKMVLNGSEPYRPGTGVALIKGATP
jgi:hypothetical protein